MREGDFKIDHPLFEDIIFSDKKAAERAAEKLCFFLVRNTDRFESHVDVLKYATDEGSTGNGVETIWWWHKTVTAELNLRGQE